MRLIDAMAYRKVLEEEKDYQLEHYKNSLQCRMGLEIAIADLGDMPTIDAVPVVRCKDCRHRSDETKMGCYFCNHKMLGLIRPDDFCSYGERMAGD